MARLFAGFRCSAPSMVKRRDEVLRPLGDGENGRHVGLAALVIVDYFRRHLHIRKSVRAIKLRNGVLVSPAVRLAVSSATELEGRRGQQHSFAELARIEVPVARSIRCERSDGAGRFRFHNRFPSAQRDRETGGTGHSRRNSPEPENSRADWLRLPPADPGRLRVHRKSGTLLLSVPRETFAPRV